MGARGCIVLAVGTVEIARLIYDRESHAAAGGVRGQEEPVAGHRVEEQESHEPHRQSVGGVCGKDDWGDVDYTVDVGQRHHHHSERHGHCVRRGTRKILLQPQQHLSFAPQFPVQRMRITKLVTSSILLYTWFYSGH